MNAKHHEVQPAIVVIANDAYRTKKQRKMWKLLYMIEIQPKRRKKQLMEVLAVAGVWFDVGLHAHTSL